MKPFIDLRIVYKDLVVNFISGGSFVRKWQPNCQGYHVNIIGAYIYRGAIEEYRQDNDEFVGGCYSENLYNTNYVLNYPTYEHYRDDCVWVCIESNKPLQTEYMRLDGDYVVPANTGVYCLLGNFRAGNEIEARALNYMNPRSYDMRITGNAKVLLITKGEYVNRPKDLLY
jgi:hypothetical protein